MAISLSLAFQDLLDTLRVERSVSFQALLDSFHVERPASFQALLCSSARTESNTSVSSFEVKKKKKLQ